MFDEERKDFEKYFLMLDKNKDGSISLKELTDGNLRLAYYAS